MATGVRNGQRKTRRRDKNSSAAPAHRSTSYTSSLRPHPAAVGAEGEGVGLSSLILKHRGGIPCGGVVLHVYLTKQ